ncbi:hypothetical protein I6N96_13220 [Enterococcus sp. BWM-S5]|uniref:DUF4358 domain-containing protein n=1 Tax=Enterococcus larvae TaxID=2794352 RepID=A0ABS4CKW3_9ENTE|nr:hypothetical protein [Enterococcus larvae]MBP1047237.1 hypothetical protein [Enterococcus larvae]
MKKISLFIIVYLTALVISGCQENAASINEKEPQETAADLGSTVVEESLADSTEESRDLLTDEQNKDDVEEISSDKFMDTIKQLDKAVVLVGDPTATEYKDTLENLITSCDEMSVDLYQTDLTDQVGVEIKNRYKFADAYDILVVVDGKMQKIEIGGGDTLNADILKRVFTIYGL